MVALLCLIKQERMAKERRVVSVPSNRVRVSPYPLRSTRTKKEKAPEESPIETEGASQWEEVRCVICMEPPHNAVLLHCSSSSKGCRPYMCDTSGRHSNCFKQYRKNSKNRLTPKSLNCPLCRGEVYETMKVKGARRFMNAKPRSCTVEDCDFSGTYTQLDNHLKTGHTGFTPPRVDPGRQAMWERMERESEYDEILSALGMQRQQHRVPFTPPTPVIQFRIRNLTGPSQVRSGFAVASFRGGLMPSLQIRTMALFPGLP
ncbi:unnamed protein product [Microthlaspi erraticum]|uniref:Uncharacterized protein n=1 Tax=Microthlaspi erraticum TaxID=1685480 RepID=A0A6D2IAV9_9BRAS|nr:unnamed protein product [Microthlaspi erraticum]CAA7048927.1 unnamed protein product [Microthlaspi erraticum]